MVQKPRTFKDQRSAEPTDKDPYQGTPGDVPQAVGWFPVLVGISGEHHHHDQTSPYSNCVLGCQSINFDWD